MANDLKTLTSLVLTQLAAGYSTTAIAYENTEFNQTPGTAFVSVAVHVPGSDLISIGSVGGRSLRITGTLEIDIFIPAAQGTGDALSIADELTALFQLKKFSNMQMGESRLGLSQRGMKDVAGSEFFMLPWFCSFEYDTNA